MSVVRKLFVIAVALIAAAVAALLTFMLVAYLTGWGDESHIRFLAMFISEPHSRKARVLFALAGLGAALSLFIVAMVFEVLRLRSWLWYGAFAVGAILSLELAYAALFDRIVPNSLLLPQLFLPGKVLYWLSACAALAASGAYWFLVGRNAGRGW